MSRSCGVCGCNVLFHEEDTETLMELHDLKHLIVAYNFKNDVLAIVPMERPQDVKRLRELALQDAKATPFVAAAVPCASSQWMERQAGRIEGSNAATLGGRAAALWLDTERTRVWSDGGLVAIASANDLSVKRKGRRIEIVGNGR